VHITPVAEEIAVDEIIHEIVLHIAHRHQPERINLRLSTILEAELSTFQQ
jgi:hypothetical protein